MLRGPRLALRPLVAEDAARLREIHETPEVAAWWGQPEEGFPFSDDPDATRWTIVAEGETAGLVQYTEERDPNYRHARVDIFLAPEFHNRGLGTEALGIAIEYLLDQRGHHRITIDPALDNHAAIRCYEKAGFERVGVMRRAARDAGGVWRDILLMELVKPQEQTAGLG